MGGSFRRVTGNTFPQMRRVALNVKSAGNNALAAAGGGASRIIGAIRSEATKRRHGLQRTNSGTALTVADDLLPAMVAMWKDKSLDELPVCKDLPRLVRRVAIIRDDDSVVYEPPSLEADNENSSVTRYVELTGELMLALVREMEGADREQELRPELAKVVERVKPEAEAEGFVREMFKLCGDETSPAMRALKSVHQDVVGHCTLSLKQHITTRFMTKDVRTPNGWRIRVRVSKDAIQVYHIRREQSVEDKDNRQNHWEFEWELRLLFDPQVTEMRHAQLRVTDLFLSQGIDPQLEENIKKDLLGNVA